MKDDVISTLDIILIINKKNGNLSEIHKIYFKSSCEFVVSYILKSARERARSFSSSVINVVDLKHIILNDRNLNNILMANFNLNKYVCNYKFIDVLTAIIISEDIRLTSGVRKYLNYIVEYLIHSLTENFPDRGVIIDLRIIIKNKLRKEFFEELDNYAVNHVRQIYPNYLI